jgi:hypothetical protein
MSKIPLVYNKVKSMLEKHPHLRNSDSRLVASFWHDELKSLSGYADSQFDTLRAYAEGKLTEADEVTRARRKAQEHNENLRGEKWYKSHKKQETVKTELRTIAALEGKPQMMENYQKTTPIHDPMNSPISPNNGQMQFP